MAVVTDGLACKHCRRVFCEDCGHVGYRRWDSSPRCIRCNSRNTRRRPVHHRIWLTCPYNRKGGAQGVRERERRASNAE